jgi:hypothetical protein
MVDQNTDTGVLLVRSLSRKFPAATIQVCTGSEAALEWISRVQPDAVVVHRTFEDDAVSLTIVKTFQASDVDLT